jgi:hypothetical protein
MSDIADQLRRSSADRERMLANRAFIVLGLIPLALSCLFVPAAFGPVAGLCPLDIFHVSVVPSPQSLSLWKYGSWLGVGFLLALALFKRPFGLVFLTVESVSFAVLLIRLGEAMKW